MHDTRALQLNVIMSMFCYLFHKHTHTRARAHIHQLNGYDCDGKFCGLLVESVNETDLTLAPSVFQVGDVIVEINYHILANYTYER